MKCIEYECSASFYHRLSAVVEVACGFGLITKAHVRRKLSILQLSAHNFFQGSLFLTW